MTEAMASVAELSWMMVLVGAGACTSAPVVEPKPTPAPVPVKREEASFEQSVGALNEHDVERAFGKLQKAVSLCVASGATRVEAIGGSFELSLRIGPHGETASAHLSRSTLGDRETERCILQAAAAKTWPRPKGGVGEATHEYAIESSVAVTEWTSGRLKPVMPQIHEKVAKCVMPLAGKWHATLYIRQSGRVASSGVAPPNADSGEQADCLVGVLNKFRFGPQRSKLSKVSFTIP